MTGLKPTVLVPKASFLPPCYHVAITSKEILPCGSCEHPYQGSAGLIHYLLFTIFNWDFSLGSRNYQVSVSPNSQLFGIHSRLALGVR